MSSVAGSNPNNTNNKDNPLHSTPDTASVAESDSASNTDYAARENDHAETHIPNNMAQWDSIYNTNSKSTAVHATAAGNPSDTQEEQRHARMLAEEERKRVQALEAIEAQERLRAQRAKTLAEENKKKEQLLEKRKRAEEEKQRLQQIEAQNKKAQFLEKQAKVLETQSEQLRAQQELIEQQQLMLNKLLNNPTINQTRTYTAEPTNLPKLFLTNFHCS